MRPEDQFENSTEQFANASKRIGERWRWLDAVLPVFGDIYAKPVHWRVGVGVAAVIIGLILRLPFWNVLEINLPYLTFYPLVELAALAGGFVSGGVAAILAAIVSHFLIDVVDLPRDWLGLTVFLIGTTVVTLASELLHRNWIRVTALEAEIAKAEFLDGLKTERTNTMKGLAAGIAHEINQPLLATGVYLKTVRQLLDTEPGKRPDGLAEALDKASAQLTRAGEIVNRLRKFFSWGEPDMTSVAMHELIQNAYASTSRRMSELGIQPTLQLNAKNDNVLADKILIAQVLVNLIRNAKEAMETAEKRDLVVSTSSSDTDFRIDVTDTGGGLSEEAMRTLFEPFRTTKAAKMGVGLAISRSIIEAHHGRIWAQSGPAGGTVLAFTLPLALALDGVQDDA